MKPARPPGKIKALGAATAAATAQAASLVKSMTPQRALEAVRAINAARRRPDESTPTTTPAGVLLRRGDPADLPRLLALHQSCGLGTEAPPDLARLASHWDTLTTAGAEVWLAERDGEVLGALTLYLLPLLARGGSRAAWVDDLAVHPRAHQLGIARRLITLATEQARAAGACKLALAPRQHPGRHDASASTSRSFLERLAYSRHGRRLDLPPAPDGAA
jgi:GNAT superfamily N-acetyltransferase